MGFECCFNMMMEKEIINMVYYEVGYVIVGYLMLEYDLFNKVIIVLCG